MGSEGSRQPLRDGPQEKAVGGSVPLGRGHRLCRPPAAAASPAPAEPPRPVVPPVGPGTARPSARALGGQDGPVAAPGRNFGPPRPPRRQLRPHTRTAPASGSRGSPTQRPGGRAGEPATDPRQGTGRGGGGRTGTARKGSGAARGRREGFLRGCWFTLEVLHSDVADVPDELLALEPVPLLPSHGDGGTRGRPLRGRGEVKGGRREPAAPPPPPSPAPTAAAERAGGRPLSAPRSAPPRGPPLPARPPPSVSPPGRERWNAVAQRGGVGWGSGCAPPPTHPAGSSPPAAPCLLLPAAGLPRRLPGQRRGRQRGPGTDRPVGRRRVRPPRCRVPATPGLAALAPAGAPAPPALAPSRSGAGCWHSK